MNILLTGGTGYIGSHTAIELINEGHQVVILDNLFNSKITVLDKIQQITGTRPDFYEVDLLDYDKVDSVFNENHFDLVMHFAGLKAVGESVEKPLKYYENNILGTINLLKAMEKYGCDKIIFSSSATVYGDQPSPRLTEDLQTGNGITNPYGQTKFMIEQILRDVTVSNPDFGVTILRYFNPIGNHPSGLIGEDPNGIPNNLMPIIMKVAQGKIAQLQVYGDDYSTQDGSCIRDYIHVVDLAKGHVAAMHNLAKGVKIYNLGSGRGTSVLEMIAAFDQAVVDTGAQNLKSPLPYVIAPRRAGDLAEIYADPSKAERELNWKTTLSIKDAMCDTIKFLQNQD